MTYFYANISTITLHVMLHEIHLKLAISVLHRHCTTALMCHKLFTMVSMLLQWL